MAQELGPMGFVRPASAVAFLLAVGCVQQQQESQYWHEGHVLYMTKTEVAERMASLAHERFFPLPPETILCGSDFHVDTLSTGVDVGTLTLQYQVDNVVTHNADVVPVLLEYLAHEKKYVRYITASALARITGRNPRWFIHGVPGQPFNGSTDWYEKAVKSWSDWYEAAQPQRSTGVASHSDGRDQ